MRINELLVEQQLDELGLGDVGRAAAKGVGGLAKGIGATVGGAVGAWDAAKQGYQVGRGTVGGAGAPVQAQQAAQWSAQQAQHQKDANAAANLQNQQARLAQASQGSDAEVPQLTQPTTGQTPAVQQQQSQAAQQQKIGVGQINKIIPTLNSKQLTSIKTAIDQRVQSLSSKKPTPAGQPAPAQIPNTGGSSGYSGMPAAGTITNQPVSSNVPGRTFESREFYSKFLGQNL